MAASYYEVLGVAPDAAIEEIERAYRERVLETHPDHNDDPDATERFTAITTAADVLTDDTERARYDRLGHVGYTGQGRGEATEESDESTSSESEAKTEPGWPDEEWWERVSSTAQSDETEQTGPSHHARQRARRQYRARTERDWWTAEDPFERTDGDPSDADADRSTSAGETGRTGWGSAAGEPRSDPSTRETDAAAGTGESSAEFDRSGSARTQSTPGSVTSTATASPSPPGGSKASGLSADARTRHNDGFTGYTVTQWEDDVALESPFRRLDGTTLVVGWGIAVLYPIFVYATLTPAFPWPVNLAVGCCTLVLIGYLLTIPQIALAAFGGFSLLASLWVFLSPSVSPLSAFNLAVLAGFWIPFGYAIAVWWVLKQ